MASFTITTYTNTAQTLVDFDYGLITQTGTLNGFGSAVSISNSGAGIAKLTVLGTLISQTNSASGKAVNFTGAEFNMYIGTGATVLTPGLGSIGIYLDATDKVLIANNGSIFSTLYAIQSRSGDSYSGFNLLNTGTITSGLTAIDFVDQAGVAKILNSGTIIGSDYGINNVSGVANAHLTILDNTGTIQGATASYVGSDGIDKIYNSGTMSGAIDLKDGNDLYIGRSGNVVGPVAGGGGDDKLVGGVDDDTFQGDAGNDILNGNDGDDSLSGGSDDDILRGGQGNDLLDGGLGNDDLLGGSGDDFLWGGDGNDTLKGGAGDDEMLGDLGSDSLTGGAGNDFLSGDAGKDYLGGGAGDDYLDGGANRDFLEGGRGDDILTGGGGRDDFIFNRNAGNDRITDFKNGTDKIDLSAFGINPADYATTIAPALSNAGGGDTFLDLSALGGQGSVLIEGLAFSEADLTDFIL